MYWRIAATAISIAALAACSGPPAATPKAKADSQPGPVRITMFYSYPAAPEENKKVKLCYGVENATALRLDPPVDRVWPSPNHCLEVPARKATYTLIAERGDEKVSQSVKVTPVPPKVMLYNVSISKNEIRQGEAVSVCFNALNSIRANITPGSWIGPHGPSLGCVKDEPKRDTTYVITVKGAGGDSATEQVTARVKPN